MRNRNKRRASDELEVYEDPQGRTWRTDGGRFDRVETQHDAQGRAWLTGAGTFERQPENDQ